jgi:hypothetical protein
MAVREKKKRQPDVALSHDEVPTLDVDGGDEKERVFRVGEARLRHTLFAVEAMDGLVGPGVGVEQVGPDSSAYCSGTPLACPRPPHHIVVNSINPNCGKTIRSNRP